MNILLVIAFIAALTGFILSLVVLNKLLSEEPSKDYSSRPI